MVWGITSAGQEHTAQRDRLNGMATYGALALGAPLGVVMEQHWGLGSIGAADSGGGRGEPDDCESASGPGRWCMASICRFARCWGA